MSLILAEPNRIDKFKGWLYARHITYGVIGKSLGITPPSVLKIINAETVRPERVEQLRALGIPEELLPEARYTPPGPKPKRAENIETAS